MSLFNVAAAEDGVTYTYYSSGLLKSKTMIMPDLSGNIYYKYLNENWQGQGYGRISRAKRKKALNGEWTYIYTYYPDSVGRMHKKVVYSDSGWSKKILQYVYANDDANRMTAKYVYETGNTTTYAHYNNEANRLCTKTTILADATGNIYYRYIDEDWKGQGYGRIDRSKLKVALNGEWTFRYTYYSDNNGRMHTKVAYSGSNWSKMVARYVYANGAANRLIAKHEYLTGNTYYRYIDENWNSTGFGRVDRLVAAVVDADGARSFAYTYFAGSAQAQFKHCYSDAAFTTPVVTYEYNSTGVMIKKAPANGNVYTYYVSARLESATLATPDASGNVYYHYKDEAYIPRPVQEDMKVAGGIYSFRYKTVLGYTYAVQQWVSGVWTTIPGSSVNGTGDYVTFSIPVISGSFIDRIIVSGEPYQRVDFQKLASADSDGAIAYKYTYGGIIDRMISKATYGSIDIADPNNPVVSALRVSYNYYDNANSRLSLKTVENETSVPVSSEFYNKKTKYYYRDAADFNNGTPADTTDDYGRFTRIDNVTDNYYYTFTYSATEIIRVTVKAKKNLATNAIIETYTYYDNAANRMHTKTMTLPDSEGFIYYRYLDEDWQEQGLGRIDRIKRATALNGELSYSMMYCDDTYGLIYRKNAYNGFSWDGLLASYYYYNDSARRFQSKSVIENGIHVIYTYYNNVDNRIESKMLAAPDSYGNIYYHYEDHICLDGNQRVDYEYRALSDPQGYILHMYTYVGDTNQVAYMTGRPAYGDEEYPVYTFYYASGNLALTKYTRPVYDPYPLTVYAVHLMDENFYGNGKGRADWKKTDNGYIFYTYWNMTDRVESERFESQDANSNVWRHYIDEVWENSHGRLDLETREAANSFGEISFKYDYYNKLWPVPGTDERTNIIHHVWSYSDQEQTIPRAMYVYDRNGNLINRVVYQTTYYADTGHVESVTLPAPDEAGYVYYHFINENRNGTGRGRYDKAVLGTPDSNGYSAYTFTYAEGSESVIKRCGYNNGDYSNPSYPEFTSNSGNGSIAVAWDEEHVYVHTYRNNWIWVIKQKISYLDPAKTQKYEQWNYQYYYDYMGIPGNDQNILVRHVFFSPGVVESFYGSERLESMSFGSPNGEGFIYRHFMDEPAGRCDINQKSVPDERGAVVYVYSYYGTGTVVMTKTGYSYADHADTSRPVYSGKVFEIGYNQEGNQVYEETYYEGDFLNRRNYSAPDENGILVYEYFYEWDGSSMQFARERRYYGDSQNGVVREYLTGENAPVKVIDRENGIIYRKVDGNGSTLTLRIRYYEDYPESGYPWGSFELGRAGENVYVKDVMVGTHLKQRFFFVSSEDLDLESGIDWNGATEVDVAKYSMYEVEPHWEVGEPYNVLNSYPFTYYSSGRVKTWFERTVHEVWFTRSEESTGRVYEYLDETFYPEENVGGFLADMIYGAKGSLSDNGLKYYLSNLNPDNFANVASLKAHLYADANESNNYSQWDISDTISRILLMAPYEARGRLSKVTEPDGTYKVFTYAGNTDHISSVRIYDIQDRLLEERVSADPGREYIAMGSLPWVRYGEQLGTRWYDGWHGGFSKGRAGSREELTGYEELRAAMRKWSGTENNPGYVRMFLVSDLRAGVVFAANGVPTGFTDYVYEDMDVLLQVADELNVKLIPALFDYRIADGYSDSIERDYPGFFTDQTLYNGKTKTEWLVELFRPFIAAYGNNENIYAWDVINEPEMMGEDRQGGVTGITMGQVMDFTRKFVEMIHEETYNTETGTWAKVTVGSLTKGDMAKYWIGPDNAMAPGDERALDFYQFHYYDSSAVYHNADFESLNYGKNMLSALAELNDGFRYFYAPTYLNAKQVICGELDPTYVQDKLDTVASGGYDGMIFWDDRGNVLSQREYQEASEWAYGTVTTYDPLTGNIVSRRGPGLEDPLFVYYHYDAYGRLDIAVRKDADGHGATAYTYEYHTGSYTPGAEKAYHTARFIDDPAVPALSDPVYTKYYDAGGSQAGPTVWAKTYYTDTWYAASETLPEADNFGVTYRKFLNESWNVGNGREDIEYHPGWGYAYQFQFLGDSYTRIGAFKYSDIDTIDPSNPVLSGFAGYESWSSGIENIAYYDQSLNLIESRTFCGADNLGNIYYHYLDDNWHNAFTNYMRVDYCRRGVANEKGELAFRFLYYDGDAATSVKSILSYSDQDMMNPVAGYEFDLNGRIAVSRLYAAPNANGESALRYDYYDAENNAGYHFVTSYNSSDMGDENIMAQYEYSQDGNLIGFTHYETGMSGSLNNTLAEDEFAEKSGILALKESQFTGYSPKIDKVLYNDR